MTTYERVTYRKGGGYIAVILENSRESTLDGEPVLVGREVDNEGMPKEPSRAYLKAHQAETGEVLHMLALDLITRRVPLEMDLFFGTLVAKGRARIPVKGNQDQHD